MKNLRKIFEIQPNKKLNISQNKIKLYEDFD